jgi:hypothetical protein
MALDLETLKRKDRIQTEFVGSRIDKETKKDLDRLCKKQDISVSTFIYGLIKDYFNTNKE